VRNPDLDFILLGAADHGRAVYLRQPALGANVWAAYDFRPGGELTNPRLIFGQLRSAGWRGLPEIS